MARCHLLLSIVTAWLLSQFSEGSSVGADLFGVAISQRPLEDFTRIIRGKTISKMVSTSNPSHNYRRGNRFTTTCMYLAFLLPPRFAASAGTPHQNWDEREMTRASKNSSVSSVSSSLRLQKSGNEVENNEHLRQAIENLASIIGPPPGSPNAATQSTSATTVHIIGTGLTPSLSSLPISTLLTLSTADVVLYDSLGLSYEDICKIVPKHCEVICVGKRGDSKNSWKQSDIDDLILQMALGDASPLSETYNPKESSNTLLQGKGLKRRTIVRLKGGDPFLFGRTRTEIESLRSNNIPYTYTPNISSCLAGPHLGGIPLTDALLDCQSFGVWSGTDAFGRSRGLNDGGNKNDETTSQRDELNVDTLVFLMIGRLDKLEALCNTLIKSGTGNQTNGSGGNNKTKWNSDTPCAIIQNAGGKRSGFVEGDNLPMQRVWRSTLGNVISDIRKEDETITSVSPAVFVVGATCQLDLLAQ